MDEWLKYQKDRRAFHVERAFEALSAARREIAHIQQQLERAHADESYVRIERIDGIDAQAVFTAFADIERIAQLEKFLAEITEKRGENDVDTR